MGTKEPDQLTELAEYTQESDEEARDDLRDEDDDAYEADEVDGERQVKEQHDEETVEALEELESEELKLLDEEVSDALLVDEVKELRAIRREELTMDVDAQVARSDEFVCQSCFLVKRTSQLANRRKMLCADCAS